MIWNPRLLSLPRWRLAVPPSVLCGCPFEHVKEWQLLQLINTLD